MTRPAKPTPAQLTALRLADLDATGIRYYCGGWYSIPAFGGPDQCARRDSFLGPNTTLDDLRDCVSRGWLADSREGEPPVRRAHEHRDRYARRWTLTEAGRAVLVATEPKP